MSPPSKSGGDIGMVSVHAPVRIFRPLFGKVIIQLISNLVNAFAGSMFRTDSILGNFGPLMAKKNNWERVQMVISDHYLKKYSHNPIQTCGVHLLGECSELISFWVMLAQFWPFRGQKTLTSGSKWWFPTIIWTSIHTVQFKLGVYTYWVSVQNWFFFGCPVGHKITENGGFQPFSEKVFMQSNSNLLSTLIGWLFRIGSLLGHVGPILAL